MASFTAFARFRARRTQRKSLDATRRALANLSDQDLADMGAKRYHANQMAKF
jgi:uncharacterized protein YjiS (DUF1127 family)